MMKFETLKSIVLITLIMLSLLLTLGIWRYQPNYEYADSVSRPIEANIGGHEQTKKNTIHPSQIIYHQEETHSGLIDKRKEKQLYEMIQSYSYYDFSINRFENEEKTTSYENAIELIFPASIPTTLIRDIFTIEEDSVLPESGFNRIYISLDVDKTDNQVVFENTDTGFSIGANIQNITEVRQELENFRDMNEFQPYLVYRNNNLVPIYVPEQVNLYKGVFSFKNISITPLRNVLFNTPSAVRSSGYTDGSQLYTDGSKAMIVYKHHIEYTNPTPAETYPMEGRQLITQTLEFVNDHSGWTTEAENQYQLYNLNQRTNTVQYYLTHGAYPVFENSNLSMISVTMRNQNVYQYIRPLIQLKDSFGDGQLEDLETGSEIVTLLENDKRFESRAILDIAVGYKMEEQQGGQIFILTPKWYIKDYSGWKELDTTQDMPVNRGGDNSVMGSN